MALRVKPTVGMGCHVLQVYEPWLTALVPRPPPRSDAASAPRLSAFAAGLPLDGVAGFFRVDAEPICCGFFHGAAMVGAN